jgi:hypothetical protein
MPENGNQQQISISGSGNETCPVAVNAEQIRQVYDFGDIVFSWSTYRSSEAGIATDNVYLYTSMWQEGFGAPPWFRKYELQTGVKADSFDIPGITGIRDMAWDGEYFYGSNVTADIFKMNFTTHTLEGTIHTEVTGGIRHIAYDTDRDGFWCGDWTELYFVDRSGHILETGTDVVSAYGGEYDHHTSGGPYIWLFCQTGPNMINLVQYRLDPVEPTGVIIDPSNVPNFIPGGTSGGLCSCILNEKFILIGDIQQSPNLIFAIEIAPSSGVDGQEINTIKIYPNPASGVMAVNSDYVIDDIQISNPQGQILLFFKPENLTKSVSLNVSGHRSGVYFLKVSTSKGDMVNRIIIY